MTSWTTDAAKRLHSSPHLGVFYVTGGGNSLCNDLLAVPGASATVLEASVPYAESALADRLGGTPDQACSADTARALAMAAWQRARKLASDTAINELFGFGCTAALATNRAKRGEHRAHLAVQTISATATLNVVFDKGDNGMGDRGVEDAEITALAMGLLETMLSVPLKAPSIRATSITDKQIEPAAPQWARLLSRESLAESNPPLSVSNAPASPILAKVLFPGSFNPLHRGHLAMAEHASQTLGQAVAFEICIDNVDKPALGYHDLQKRSVQFVDHTLWLTRLPTFIEKARQFPQAVFVVGIDTLTRIGMARYYASNAEMHKAFAEFAQLGNRFLVFGRESKGAFLTLTNSEVPDALRALCDEVGERDFRIDLSSSELRNT